ncbi:MAG: translation initiation factor IF-3, partial [Gammaproteobacteria bacterium]
MSFGGRRGQSRDNRINDDIDEAEVRLIGVDGESVGVVTIAQALEAAYDVDVDLVEISPNAEPPVCRIMDSGKYLVEM